MRVLDNVPQSPKLCDLTAVHRRAAPTLVNGRTCCQTFKAISMIRTKALVSILRMSAYNDMPHLGMRQSMNHFPANYSSRTNTCTYSYIQTAIKSLSSSPGRFPRAAPFTSVSNVIGTSKCSLSLPIMLYCPQCGLGVVVI